ncbi:MAG: lipase family protein, partial [Planctomycetota bacterium]
MNCKGKMVAPSGYALLFAIFMFLSMPLPSYGADAATEDSGKGTENITSAKTTNCFNLFESSAEGHIPENAYLLALACHYNYHEKLDVVPFEDFKQFQEKYRKLFSTWGIDTFEFIQSSGRAFDTELIVMSPSEGDYVIVVFRGSERIEGPVSAVKDAILTDANCTMLDVSDNLGEGVTAHEGFWNAFVPVEDKVVETIEKQGGFSPGKKLWITGNSLGAALANLCAASLEKKGHDVHAVYTYGAPMCGNEDFRKLYDEELAIECQRYVNDNDIVPLLPPKKVFREFRHVGTANIIKDDGTIELDGKEHEGIGNPFKHYQEFYAYRLYHLLPKETQTKMPPPP